MLKVSHVYKYFDDQCVNNDICLDLREGEIFGLLGPNGAGKTTLMRMLATVTSPDRGEILLGGEPLTYKHVPLIGYMPEERGLYRKMSVVDQLLYFAELKGLSRSMAKIQVKKWLQRLEIIHWADKKMEELSKGMAQKIQFISTILHEPKFLILDEPFSGFDPVNADMVKDLIIELKNAGTTILFSTHRMDNVEELCHRLAILHEGRKVLDGSISEVRQSHFRNEYNLSFAEAVTLPAHFKGELLDSNSPNSLRVTLTENQTDKNLLDWAYETQQLKSFGAYLPTMHEIFISKVSNQ
jgi:ABC-2 type transport system ATP-binding protein